MSIASEVPGCEAAGTVITRPLIILFAISVAVIVTNLFSPQTLIGLIGPELGLAKEVSGLIAMATMLGYATGLFLLVPLADLLENRRLILRLLACVAICAGAAALAPNAGALIAALFGLGASCCAIQILVPIAAAMAPEARRGRVIGDVMSGLMFGILLSRPLASAISDAFGWRAFYGCSAAAMVLLACMLAAQLPQRRPALQAHYRSLIISLWHLLRDEPVLRRRALTAGLSLAAFSLFWTSVALRLVQTPFDLDQRGIALFALAGAGGAIATPFAGRAGDKGYTRSATIAAHIVAIASFMLAAWAGTTEVLPPMALLVLMGLAAILLDIGIMTDQTLGRREINLIRPEARGRLNGLFTGLFFLGGAVGSALAGIASLSNGWEIVCIIGGLFSSTALIVAGRSPRA